MRYEQLTTCLTYQSFNPRQTLRIDIFTFLGKHHLSAIAIMSAVQCSAAAVVAALLWLYRINRAMEAVPDEVAKITPHRWTKQVLREAYERVKQKPIDFGQSLPPRLDRRYVIVGGSGEPFQPSHPSIAVSGGSGQC